MPVLGMGGLFFRANDPDALSAWYRDRLGVGGGCAAPGAEAGDAWTWGTTGGPMMFQPFPASSDYFSADKPFMLNFRVSGLDALLVTLRAADIAVETRAEWDSPETGRFARLHDPEGNPLELWEPPTA